MGAGDCQKRLLQVEGEPMRRSVWLGQGCGAHHGQWGSKVGAGIAQPCHLCWLQGKEGNERVGVGPPDQGDPWGGEEGMDRGSMGLQG